MTLTLGQSPQGTTSGALGAAPLIWQGQMRLSSQMAAYYINGRWYEPAGRRFLSEGGGLSGYRFGNNNPTARQTVSRYATDSKHGYTEPSFASIFWENYTHSVNPANQWADGNYAMAVAQYAGWGAFVVGSGGAGVAYAGAGAGAAGAAFAAGGALLGGTHAALDTYAANPNASFMEYAASAGLGAGFGALNPVGEIVSAAGAIIGGSIDAANGGDFLGRGFLAGGLAGSIVGGGIDDGLRALGKGATGSAVTKHAAKYVGVQGGFAAGGAAVGYATTGTVDGALLGANLGSMAGGIAASRMVACFAGGTPILTPDGHKMIEELQPGDLVLSRDEDDVNGKVVAKRVEEVFVRPGVIFHLHVGGQVFRTTAEHPFYEKVRGWTPAGELEIGDLLATHDGRWIPVEDLFDTGEIETVYNLRVANYHTYFVGGQTFDWNIWAHNRYLGNRRIHETGTWNDLTVHPHTQASLAELQSVAAYRAAHNVELEVAPVVFRVNGAPTADGGVVAKLNYRGHEVFRANYNAGKNMQEPANFLAPAMSKYTAAVAWRHAEGQVINGAAGRWNIGTAKTGKQATLVTDVEPCHYCGRSRGIVQLAEQAGFDRITVISPNGIRYINLT